MKKKSLVSYIFVSVLSMICVFATAEDTQDKVFITQVTDSISHSNPNHKACVSQ